MEYRVDIVDVAPHQIAAVQARMVRDRLPSLIVSSLDQVYAFLAKAPQLARGHNVVIYDHLGNIEAGVQVTGTFEGSGAVTASATPSGRAATTLHRGPYSEMGRANAAIEAWCRKHGEKLTGISWEVYGDWAEDESQLTTEVFYQLG